MDEKEVLGIGRHLNRINGSYRCQADRFDLSQGGYEGVKERSITAYRAELATLMTAWWSDNSANRAV
jgi:hypothetical protein